MIKTLKLVRGAVASRDAIPTLTHFYIGNGRIQGANGKVAIDAALPEIDGMGTAIVPADKFLKAIDACKGEPHVTVNGSRMTIKSGKFTARVSLLPEDSYPLAGLEDAPVVAFPIGLLDAMRKLYPFISTDASRPWACSILLADGYAYATNNVVLARCPVEWGQEPLLLPVYCVDELLRIGQVPECIRIAQNALYFIYPAFWLKAQKVEGAFPVSLTAVCANMYSSRIIPIPDGLLDAVNTLKPFFPDAKLPVVVFGEAGVSTQDGAHSASIECGALPKGLFRMEPLVDMLAVAVSVDFSQWPAAVPFRGDGIEGVIVGMRG